MCGHSQQRFTYSKATSDKTDGHLDISCNDSIGGAIAGAAAAWHTCLQALIIFVDYRSVLDESALLQQAW